MAIRVALNHRTTYQYDRLISLSPQVVRLRPAPHCRTPVRSFSLRVEPAENFLNWQQDPHGNYLARLVFPNQTRKLEIEVDLVAELTVINPFDFFLEADAENFPFTYATWLETELAPFLRPLTVGPKLAEFMESVPRETQRTVDFLVALNQLVHNAVKYVIRLEAGVQTCEQTLRLGSGSCRDSAWLLVQVLRNLGLAARFVSGYLIQLRPDVKPLDGPGGTDIDFTDLHAWTEVYLPGAGWVGLDPTSGLFAGEGHLPLAASPDPQSAAPITGSTDECRVEFQHHMSVQRIHEDPRVTAPYTEDQWQQIQQLGRHVDRQLTIGDVRLTMGGEPTFVSIDDMEGEEWNTAALGPDKRRRAGQLFRRLADRFASGPLLHYGQGKWYPGEQLPRWALGCYWRLDGQPIWQDPQWIAKDDQDYGVTENDAQKFIVALAQRLQVDASHVLPGYEDAWYYMWKERRLPVNVNPLDSKLDDSEERARLAKIFERGLNRVTGYTLPLKVSASGPWGVIWQSGNWFLRPETMFLIPGDSPMGYRLPLDSLPWVAKQDYPRLHERDPFAERAELPNYHEDYADTMLALRSMAHGRTSVADRERVLVHQYAGGGDSSSGEPAGYGGNGRYGYGNGEDNGNGNGNGRSDHWTVEPPSQGTTSPPQPGKSDPSVVRTAICVEARGGVLHIFMPPVSHLEEYLHLTAAIEATAAELRIPVRLEGYTPPHDYRMTNFKVTPDPGVIEVNLQPASDWEKLVDYTTVLYDEARACRLGTEKFMLDGRHTGTGGGNHLVLGGAKSSESCFLRRPDLLRSLIAYWNNRPSLSYLFSGLFIGPTSQAPRADEARHESTYELETAFTQLPKCGSQQPWIVDRVLRNLLVDVTGNTHRAEFCIDKLFSPDSSSGRLGLVEFRGFEMPPHARMSLTQQLLMRALVARFWQKPYTASLVRWGTSLHDRWMLPHFVAEDFQGVLAELTEAGFPIDQKWFDSHFEFRFPLVGQVTHNNVNIELRQAIEPWHVLGEEAGGGGTARYVDSSVERLQVMLRGLTDSRHVLTCNGRRVPLHPTGTQGEFVAGIRYRAWQPPSCLHPTIGVHAPLVFDLIDTWNNRSIGGCTWNVAHPGGRSFETFPVNSYEAESRRGARFAGIGHTGGVIQAPPRERNRDYPMTLDLRRPVELATLDD